MTGRVWTQQALVCVIFALMVISPVSLMLEGRDIENLDYFNVIDAEGPGAWLSRIVSLLILAVSLLVILVPARRATAHSTVAQTVMLGYLVFFLTNSVLNSVFGTVPFFARSQVYPLIIFAAVYMQREGGNEDFLHIAKCAILCVLLVSIPFSLLKPAVTLRSYAPEIRLPFVGFRFWGLGNSPNSTGPMALLLLLLILHRPFQSRLISAMGLAASAMILLLAQSQTAWITAALVLPVYLLYQRRIDAATGAAEHGGATALTLYVLIIFAVLAAAAGAGWNLSSIADDTSYTGRGRIWRVAVELFRENPMFGYGPAAWDFEFRSRVGMPFAFTAHNQALQSLSTAGLVGFGGWLFYVGTLVFAAARLARPTRGLAPALLISFPLIRSFSEASFDFKAILADEFIIHLVVFIVLTGAAVRPTASGFSRQLRRAAEHPAQKALAPRQRYPLRHRIDQSQNLR